MKQVYRIIDDKDRFFGADAVAMADETDVQTMHHPFEPAKHLDVKSFVKEVLLEKVIEKGERTSEPKTPADISAFRAERLSRLPEEYRRFENPHIYKVGLSDRLKQERDQLIKKYQ